MAALQAAAGQVPNWAAAELPLSDYGAVAAIKLVKSTLENAAKAYVENDPNDVFGELGRYHFFLLGRGRGILGNEAKRAKLTAAPTLANFGYPKFNREIEQGGQFAYRECMSQIMELARVYRLQPRLVIGAFLNVVSNEFNEKPFAPVNVAGPGVRDGWNVAKYNSSALARLWGTFPLGYPSGYNEHFDHLQSRGKKFKGKRRRRY